MFYLIDERINESDEVWSLVHLKYLMSQIINVFHSIEKQLLLPCCYWQCSIKSTKGLMVVIMYDVMDETMNGVDEVWRWVQHKYVMSLIIQSTMVNNSFNGFRA